LYTGFFANGMKNGTGKLYHEGKVIANGVFEDDRFVGGSTKLYDDNGNPVYDGDLVDGLYEGKGKLYDPVLQSLIYEGEFAAGMYTGKGKLYDPVTETLIYDGEFKDGKYEGKGKLYDSATG